MSEQSSCSNYIMAECFLGSQVVLPGIEFEGLDGSLYKNV